MSYSATVRIALVRRVGGHKCFYNVAQTGPDSVILRNEKPLNYQGAATLLILVDDSLDVCRVLITGEMIYGDCHRVFYVAQRSRGFYVRRERGRYRLADLPEVSPAVLEANPHGAASD